MSTSIVQQLSSAPRSCWDNLQGATDNLLSVRRKRRRLQFGVRSLLAAVTIAATIAGFIAYQLDWIRQRRAVVTRSGQSVCEFQSLDGAFCGGVCDPREISAPPARAPQLLWLLGEPGYAKVQLHIGAKGYRTRERELTPDESSEVERIKGLFPEAKITSSAYELDSLFTTR